MVLKKCEKDVLSKMHLFEKGFDSQFEVSSLEGEYLHNLVLSKKPESILELGTWRGASAIYMASALKENGFGKIVTVDLGKENSKMAKENVQRAKLSEFVEFVESDIRNYLPLLNTKFDLIFIDADKKNTVLYLDIIFKNNTKNGSIIVIDDVVKMKNKMIGLFEYLEDKELPYLVNEIGGGMMEINI